MAWSKVILVVALIGVCVAEPQQEQEHENEELPPMPPYLPGCIDPYGYRLPFFGYAGYHPGMYNYISSDYREVLRAIGERPDKHEPVKAAHRRRKRSYFTPPVYTGPATGYSTSYSDGIDSYDNAYGSATRDYYGSRGWSYGSGGVYYGNTASTSIGSGTGYSPYGDQYRGTGVGYAQATGYRATQYTSADGEVNQGGQWGRGSGSASAYDGGFANNLAVGTAAYNLGLASGSAYGSDHAFTYGQGAAHRTPYGSAAYGAQYSAAYGDGYSSATGFGVAH